MCPDHLVSGTSVVGSLFCRRKGVLSERFTGIDCNNQIVSCRTVIGNEIIIGFIHLQMAVGSMVHELFQTVISHGLRTSAEVKAVCEQLINSQGMASTLYEIQMSADQMRKELMGFVPKIVRFIEQYITGENIKVSQVSFPLNYSRTHVCCIYSSTKTPLWIRSIR